MTKSTIIAAAIALGAVAMPLTAGAQGVVRGANEGERAGERVGGPVGGVVGSVLGGVVGGVNGAVDGIMGRDTRPRFREYVVRERPPSYTYGDEVRVGSVLPGSGVTYYEAPEEFQLRTYRYTVVNGRTVLVDPATNRIVDVID